MEEEYREDSIKLNLEEPGLRKMLENTGETIGAAADAEDLAERVYAYRKKRDMAMLAAIVIWVVVCVVFVARFVV